MTRRLSAAFAIGAVSLIVIDLDDAPIFGETVQSACLGVHVSSTSFGMPLGSPSGAGYVAGNGGLQFLEPNDYSEDGFSEYHPGEDWNAAGDDLDVGGDSIDAGDPVFAIGNGIVRFATVAKNWSKSWGHLMLIEHRAPLGAQFRLPDGGSAGTVWSQYGHMSSIGTNPRTGRVWTECDVVSGGEQIGTVGDFRAGSGKNFHLHFEVRTQFRSADAFVYNDHKDASGINQPWPATAVQQYYVKPSEFVLLNPTVGPPPPTQSSLHAGFTMAAQGKSAIEDDTLNLTVQAGHTVQVTLRANCFAGSLPVGCSFDVDGAIEHWTWAVGGVATPLADAAVVTVNVGPGSHPVSLTVTDDDGLQSMAHGQIQVGAIGGETTPGPMTISVVFDGTAAFPNNRFGELQSDRQGNLIGVNFYAFGSTCGGGFCQPFTLVAIDPKTGLWNWESNDGLSPPYVGQDTLSRFNVALGANDTAFIGASSSQILAYVNGAKQAGGWPYSTSLGRLSRLKAHRSTGDVFATFPDLQDGGAVVVDPTGNERMSVSGPFLNWFMGADADAFLSTGNAFGITAITRYNSSSLAPTCTAPVPNIPFSINALADEVLETPQGLVLSYGGSLKFFDGNCQLSSLVDLPGVDFRPIGTAGGYAIGFLTFDWSTGSSGLVGVSLANGSVWSQGAIAWGGAMTTAQGFAYVLAQDAVDGKHKVYRVDPGTGNVLDRLDTTGVCASFGGCSLVSTPDGNVYLNDLNSTKIYRIDGPGGSPTPPGVNPLFSFSAVTGQSASPLTEGPDGWLYGTTLGTGNGPHPFGLLFRTSTAGIFEPLHSFDGQDGAVSNGALLHGSDGNLYGTAHGADGGVLFRYGSTIGFQVLKRFDRDPAFGSAHPDPLFPFGRWPVGAPIESPAGTIMGVTQAGGVSALGVLYQWSQADGFAVLHHFGPPAGNPSGGLTFGADGALYGATYSNQAGDAGLLYRYHRDDGFSVLYAPAANESVFVMAPLLSAGDGHLYGVSVAGGDNGRGTVFRVTLAGVFQLLHSFEYQTTGDGPRGNLLEVDGGFLGTTSAGGQHGLGTLFHVTYDGEVSVLHHFSGADGDSPLGMLLHSNGSYYGVSSNGGPASRGVIFSFRQR